MTGVDVCAGGVADVAVGSGVAVVGVVAVGCGVGDDVLLVVPVFGKCARAVLISFTLGACWKPLTW
jgi:hypothetical protein